MDQAKPGLAGIGEPRNARVESALAKLRGTAAPGAGCAARVVDRDREVWNRLGLGLDPYDLEEAAHRRSIARDAGQHLRPPGERPRHARQRVINAVNIRLDRALRALLRDHVGPPDQNQIRRTAEHEDQHRDDAAGDQQTTPNEDICHLGTLTEIGMPVSGSRSTPETADVSSRGPGRFFIVARIQASGPREQGEGPVRRPRDPGARTGSTGRIRPHGCKAGAGVGSRGQEREVRISSEQLRALAGSRTGRLLTSAF